VVIEAGNQAGMQAELIEVIRMRLDTTLHAILGIIQSAAPRRPDPSDLEANPHVRASLINWDPEFRTEVQRCLQAGDLYDQRIREEHARLYRLVRGDIATLISRMSPYASTDEFRVAVRELLSNRVGDYTWPY